MKGELYLEVTESAPAFGNTLIFHVNESFIIKHFLLLNLHDDIIITSELGRAKVFIPISKLKRPFR